jgi:hypothetical protein
MLRARNHVGGTAADPLVEFAKLEIDGKTYELAWSFNAIATAERSINAGRPVEERVNLLHGVAALLVSAMAAEELQGLLFAALSLAHPKLTMKESNALVRIDTLVDIKNALLRAYNVSMPEAKRFIVDPPPAGAAELPDPPPAQS